MKHIMPATGPRIKVIRESPSKPRARTHQADAISIMRRYEFSRFVRRFYNGQSLRKQTAKLFTSEQTHSKLSTIYGEDNFSESFSDHVRHREIDELSIFGVSRPPRHGFEWLLTWVVWVVLLRVASSRLLSVCNLVGQAVCGAAYKLSDRALSRPRHGVRFPLP